MCVRIANNFGPEIVPPTIVLPNQRPTLIDAEFIRADFAIPAVLGSTVSSRLEEITHMRAPHAQDNFF